MATLPSALEIVLASSSAVICAACAPISPTLAAQPPVAPAIRPETTAAPAGPPPANSTSVANPAPPASAPLTAIEAEFVLAINRERTARGLGALVPDARLTEAARAHSREMGELGYFDHRSPTPGHCSPLDRFIEALGREGQSVPDGLLLGENIYHISEFNRYFDVEFGHRAIMASPSHKAAILEPLYTKVGVGVFRDARGELWATQMFMRDEPWPPGASVSFPVVTMPSL